MKMISKEVINGKTVITAEEKKLFRKKIRKFEAQREFPPGYWDWLELPNKILVADSLSFQLNAWNKIE